MTDASNVGGGGTLFQWQALEKEEFDSAISNGGRKVSTEMEPSSTATLTTSGS